MKIIGYLLNQIGLTELEINQASTSHNYVKQLLGKRSQRGEAPHTNRIYLLDTEFLGL